MVRILTGDYSRNAGTVTGFDLVLKPGKSLL
jgi:hypothetical protein